MCIYFRPLEDIPRAGETAQWRRTLPTKTNDRGEFDPWNPHGRTETASAPLHTICGKWACVFVCTHVWVHTRTYTQMEKTIFDYRALLFTQRKNNKITEEYTPTYKNKTKPIIPDCCLFG